MFRCNWVCTTNYSTKDAQTMLLSNAILYRIGHASIPNGPALQKSSFKNPIDTCSAFLACLLRHKLNTSNSHDVIWLEYKIDSYNDYVKLEIQGMQARGDAMDAENVLTNMLMSYLVVEDQVFIQSTWIGNKITSMIGSS